MKPDEWLILSLTFLTGVFAGAALYVMAFAPQYKADPVEERARYSIVGEQYGGCALVAAGCPSFRLDETGSYQYLHGSDKEEGRLPNQQTEAIFSELSDSDIHNYALSAARETCGSYVDGIDYRYEVVLDGDRLTLNTCTTAFPADSNLQREILRAWEYMSEPDEYPTIVEEGVGAWLIERFQNSDSQ